MACSYTQKSRLVPVNFTGRKGKSKRNSWPPESSFTQIPVHMARRKQAFVPSSGLFASVAPTVTGVPFPALEGAGWLTAVASPDIPKGWNNAGCIRTVVIMLSDSR